MTAALLTINSGSSSVKFQVFTNTDDLELLAIGKVSDLGTAPSFSAENQLANTKERQLLDKSFDHRQALGLILQWVKQQSPAWEIRAIAHRVVHGGESFTKSVLVDENVMEQLRLLEPLAPLHQPHNLAAIEIIHTLHPELPQIACFDTAFHADHTPLFREYALPLRLREAGIRRYGFHGLSFEWIARVLQKDHPELAQGRIIAAHLGNGASLCAMQDGKSIDTTMGLTALDGLPMGTRCGSLDPGALIYMIRELGLTAAELEHTLYNDSGLLGLSGLTNDVKELLHSQNCNAKFALNYFCLKAAQFMGMMAIALGGVDGIVFTGGIGEHSEWIRSQILERITCLGTFAVLTIPANEEKMMAMHALSLINNETTYG